MINDDGEDAQADNNYTKTIQTIEEVEEESRGLKNTLGMDDLKKFKYKHKHKKHTHKIQIQIKCKYKKTKTKTNTHKNHIQIQDNDNI